MNKIIKSSFLILGILLLVQPVKAEEASVSPSVSVKPTPVGGLIRKVIETRKEVRTDIKDVRQTTQSRTLEERRVMVDEMRDRRDEFRGDVKENRQELQDAIKEKRASLTDKLKAIKDERKKQIVERVDREIDALNERILDNFSNILDRLTDILAKISQRSQGLSDAGVDVSLVESAISTASSAIASAQVAVSVQAGKTYIINVTTEEELKGAVGAARQSLRTDLKIVQDAVQAAREAVKNAAEALMLARRNSSGSQEPTVSPSASPITTP